MKKKLLCVLILFMCFMLTGCSDDNMDQEEIDRIGNLINGTENEQE